MLPVDSARPTLSVHAAEARASRALERISLYLTNETNDFQSLRSIPLHPPREIFERRGVKFQVSQ